MSDCVSCSKQVLYLEWGIYISGIVGIEILNTTSSDSINKNLRIFLHLNGFVSCRTSPYFQCGGAYISGTEHNWKLKFSMQPGIYLTHLNTIFEYYHVFSEFRSCRCFLFKRCKCIYPVLKNKPLLFSL